MKRKIIAILMVFALSASLVACGEEEETTITGMVVSVDGTVISLVEMDTGKMSGRDFEEGERPEMPEDVEGFGGFNPMSSMVHCQKAKHFLSWKRAKCLRCPREGNLPKV